MILHIVNRSVNYHVDATKKFISLLNGNQWPKHDGKIQKNVFMCILPKVGNHIFQKDIQFERRQPDSTRLIPSCLPKNYKQKSIYNYISKTTNVQSLKKYIKKKKEET